MNVLEIEVYSHLKHGSSNATKGQIIATALGFKTDRVIRSTIRNLIEQGHPILSSVTPPYGYFIADNTKEVIDYCANLKSRLLEDARRLRDVKLATRKIRQPGQLSLF